MTSTDLLLTLSSFSVVTLVCTILWTVLFVVSKESRKEQLIMSALGLFLSPGILTMVQMDYRQNITGSILSLQLTDIIFTAVLFGIASVIYQALFAHHIHKVRGEKIIIAHPVAHWFGHLVFLLFVWVLIAFGLILTLHLSAFQGTVVASLLLVAYIIADRHELLLNSIVSGVLTATIIFLVEQLFFINLFPEAAIHVWKTLTPSMLVVRGIPAEEIIWAATIGLTIGPLYEYVRRIQFKS